MGAVGLMSMQSHMRSLKLCMSSWGRGLRCTSGLEHQKKALQVGPTPARAVCITSTCTSLQS